jgi:hypothetical protein
MTRRRPTIPSGRGKYGLSIDTAEMLAEVPCAGRAFAQLAGVRDDGPPRIHSCWKSSSSGETADKTNASMPNPPSKIAARPCSFPRARITNPTAPSSRKHKLRGVLTQRPFFRKIEILGPDNREELGEISLEAVLIAAHGDNVKIKGPRGFRRLEICFRHHGQSVDSFDHAVFGGQPPPCFRKERERGHLTVLWRTQTVAAKHGPQSTRYLRV